MRRTLEKDQNIDKKEAVASNVPAQGFGVREKLPMEKKFDQLVYGGITYGAQALAGSIATYWIKHAGGKKYFDSWSQKLGHGLVEKFTSYKGAKATEVANGWLTVTALVMVGNLFVAPVKWFEDKKVAYVERWTKEDNQAREARGEIITPEEKQHQAELLDQLKAAPKQNWWSLGVARLASLVPVFVGLRVFAGANKYMENMVQKGSAGVVKFAGFKNAAKSEILKNASGIAFYDGFYSMISAGGLYIYSHFIAPPTKAVKDELLLKEFIAPETALEEVPHKQTTTHTTSMSKKSDGFVAKLNTETPNAQMAI